MSQKITLQDKKKNTLSQGFSLVEFIVILVIFATMASIALFNFRGFRSNISISNLAHDIGLLIRQAQIFGISASGDLNIGGVSIGSQIRGVFFRFDNASGNYGKTIVLFADANANNIFESNDPVLDSVTISSDDVISEIQVDRFGNGTLTSLQEDLSITFQRPQPNAIIRDNQFLDYQKAVITLMSPDGRVRHVLVSENGQISITDTI